MNFVIIIYFIFFIISNLIIIYITNKNMNKNKIRIRINYLIKFIIMLNSLNSTNHILYFKKKIFLMNK